MSRQRKQLRRDNGMKLNQNEKHIVTMIAMTGNAEKHKDTLEVSQNNARMNGFIEILLERAYFKLIHKVVALQASAIFFCSSVVGDNAHGS